MPTEQLGIALIGCGMIARFHLTALRDVSHFRVVGVWDAVDEAAQKLAGSFGVKTYPSYQAMLDDPEVQVVDICLPSGVHAQYGVQAAQAGKHVIVEKPIDITMEAATSLVDACHANQVHLAVILQSRFSPSNIRIKEALEQGVLGRLIAGEATIKWYRNDEYYASSPWKGTKKYDGGGALMNQGIHTIDLLLWFMGDVKSLASLVRTLRHPIEVEDTAMALLQFENGAIGTITGATSMKPGFLERIEIYGEKGAIAMESGRIVRWKVDGCDEAAYLDEPPTASGSSDPAGIPVDGHRRQLTAIAAAILAGQRPPITGEEALRALRLILDIYKADGTWVTR